MKKLTTTKTILFASLIAAMILPFGGMELASAEKNIKADIKQQENSLKKSSDWAKLLLKTNDYKSLDDESKVNYLEFVQYMLDSTDPYHKDMMKLVEEYSTLELTISNSASDKDVTKEKNRKTAVVEELEEIGVATEDKHNENPTYWNEKVRNAMKDKGSLKHVSGEESGTDYHLVHTGDVSIRREAIAYSICLTNGAVCPNPVIAWGPGMSTVTSIQLITGTAGWASYGCLENDVQHTTVNWTQTGHHEKDWPWWGSPIVHTHNGNMSVSGSDNSCQGWYDTESNVAASYFITTDTVIGSTITVTGSHA